MAELKKEKQLADKNKNFDIKLSEGLVCEAQREAFLNNDMDKFMGLYSELKLSDSGSSAVPTVTIITKENVEDHVLKLASERAQEQNLPLDISIGNILSENKELADKYHGILSEA